MGNLSPVIHFLIFKTLHAQKSRFFAKFALDNCVMAIDIFGDALSLRKKNPAQTL